MQSGAKLEFFIDNGLTPHIKSEYEIIFHSYQVLKYSAVLVRVQRSNLKHTQILFCLFSSPATFSLMNKSW